MYLVNDKIGLCSRTVYGLAGDEINIIDKNRDLWLVENKGQKFFVKPNALTNVRIENTNLDKEPPAEQRVVYNKADSNKHKRNTRPIVSKGGQGNLFGD